ncbi:MAG: ATPase, partial [Clostridia bacterium]|nr:ATPase [Clostridia bacterium]
MSFYLNPKTQVLADLESNENGLTSTEAEARIEKYGKNKLIEGKKESLIHRFFKQLAEPMTIILLVAAAISAGVEIYHGVLESHMGFPSDVVIILAVVLINAILGVFQESKAEKAIEALQEIAAATSKVIRDGRQITVKSEDLVIGDIIVLE